jgi:hypothetical protein
MDGNSVSQGVIATVVIIPLITVANIILAALGCITGYFLLQGLFKMFKGAGGKIKNRASKFGKEVRQEADRLNADRV